MPELAHPLTDQVDGDLPLQRVRLPRPSLIPTRPHHHTVARLFDEGQAVRGGELEHRGVVVGDLHPRSVAPGCDVIVNPFGGPGGWDEGARPLKLYPLGIETDAAACATRAAAGHATMRADVAALNLAAYRRVSGLIASPPCQTFSTAGNRSGIADLAKVIDHVRSCVTGWHPAPDFDDPRTGLVLEPLRYALTLVPEWIALEQVPDVVPVWEQYRQTLQALGWSVWCGVLNAADYGVPQTRRRAILMAHRRRQVVPPVPTHCRGGASTLLGELAPWVSMAEALGWSGFRFGDHNQSNGCVRDDVQPAPTITSAADNGNWRFTLHTNRGQDEDGNRQTRDGSAPAPALSAKAGGQWWWEQPSTTLGGDPRVSPRCHHDDGMQGRDALDAAAAAAGEGTGVEPIKLTVRDALILQSFRPDYPVQGTKTKQFEQIGNAIPPRLAHAVLASLCLEESR